MAQDLQTNTSGLNQKNTRTFLAITSVLLLFRILVLAYNKFDIQSVLVTRSLIGNGFLSRPLFAELLLSTLLILLLFRNELISKPLASDFKRGAINSFWLLSFPAVTGLCLFTFTQQYYIKFQFNDEHVLRWLYFVLTFVAVNKLLDINPFNKFLRGFFVILILLITSFLQDFISNPGANDTLYATLSGVGLTQALSIIAFRTAYKNSFWAGVMSAVFTGMIVCFFIFGAVSANYFTFLFPPLAILLAALSMRGKSWKPGFISLGIISVVSLMLSLFLSFIFPPEKRDLVRENKIMETRYKEMVQGIQINYNDTSVYIALKQIAKVLHAANEVSRENFGISPELKWITIYGIEPGGFNGVFPHGIRGNFSSQQFIDKILDSTFLNNPELSPQFPDPVNAILHEYSHLFGIFPYQKWMSTESEGWATYSATRLSKLLFQKYGADLWKPSYNYAKIADSINVSLLAGHPLVWSHPEEVGAFRMWNDLEQKEGLKKLYIERWQSTSRDKDAISVQVNNPQLITDFINTTIGKEIFDKVSMIPPGKFDRLYKSDDWKILGQLNNLSDEQVEKHLGPLKIRKIDIKVPAPRQNSSVFEACIIITLLLLFILGKKYI